MTYRFAFLVTGLLAATAAGQYRSGIITRALEPAADDLSRLNLLPQWRLYLPVESRADAIVTVQPVDDQVFVQLQSGQVIAVQAEANPKTFKKAGEVLWMFRPARPPGIVRPLAVNPTEVYLAQGQFITILDRANGKLKYSEELESTPAAAPAADAEAIYLPLDSRRVVAFSHTEKIPGYRPPKPYEAPDPIHRMSLATQAAEPLSTPQNRSPSIARLESLRPPFTRSTDTIDSSVSVGMLRTLFPPYREINEARSPSVGLLPSLRNVYELTDKESVTRIKFLWSMMVDGPVVGSPLLTADPKADDSARLHVATGRSVQTALRSSPRTNAPQTIYVAEAPISAPLTAYGESLYVPLLDSNLLALDVSELREKSLATNTLPLGKFTTGGPILDKPLVTDDSVYVIGARWGLMRLRHKTLEPMWVAQTPDGRIRPRPTPDVSHVISASPNYVFALDRAGRLLVIDAIRGLVLSSLDVSAFSVPVTNRENDRVYLAAPGGLLLCLRERTKVVPMPLIKPAPAKKPAAAPPAEAPEPKKGPEPKDE